MAEHIQAGADALTVDVRDDVATALRDLARDESIFIWSGEEKLTVTLLENIAFGHKLAVKHVQEGAVVRKYGEVMGRATKDIKIGEHVHVHNIESIRGRGDQVDPTDRGGQV